jgi:tripartite-type tricarboxylate transporter receptor subunit TctC
MNQYFYRSFTKVLGIVVLATLGFTSSAQAQNWPDKPIKLVIPFAAGGTTDIIGRILAQQMAPILGQNVVVENRGGAGGNIGAEAVARAPADGYTLLLASGSMLTVNPYMYRRCRLIMPRTSRLFLPWLAAP